MVKVKLSCFLYVVVVILATIKSSYQGTIIGGTVTERIQRRREDGSTGTGRANTVKPSGAAKAAEFFVFPDEDRRNPQKNVDNRVFMPVVGVNPPPCANGSTFCENVDGYPTDHVISLLQKDGNSLKEFFTNDVIEHTSIVIQDRIEPTDENPLCPSKEQIIYPKAGENKNGEWLFVINGDNYKQGVRIEVCLHQEECNFANIFPNGYRTHCKQHYIYRNLIALNKNGDSVSNDQFKLPSCCTCVVKFDGNRISDRMATGDKPLPLTIPKTTATTLVNSKKRVGH